MAAVAGDGILAIEGSPQYEVFTIVTIAFLAILVRNIALPWIFLGGQFQKSSKMFWSKFLLDTLFIVLPGILSTTLLSSSITVSAIVLLTTSFVLIFFVLCEYLVCPDRVAFRTVLNKLIDEQYGPTTFVTYLRGSMLILMSIAILAVDFPVFPDRFKKTEHYGHSVMDIGVSACVFADAVGSRLKTSTMIENKEAYPRSWKRFVLSSKVLLPLIGLTRTFIIWLLNYHQPITEYGQHWNFFYTLGAIRIVSSLIPKKFPLLTFLLFSIFQQCLLHHGWEDFVLFKYNPRDSFILQNAEGLVSLMGYIALHYASLTIAEFVSKTGIRIKSWIACAVKLLLLSFSFYLIQLICEKAISPPSRRVANLTYIFSQLSLCVFGLSCMLFAQMFYLVAWAANAPHFSHSENPFHGSQPDLLDSVNKNGLWFFLLSNVVTGLVNLSITTSEVSSVGAVFIVTIYMLICCFAVHYPSSKSVKRKV